MSLISIFYNSASGKCQASGDPHYYPWDGGKIDYQGLCEHLLAGTCPEMPGDLPKWAVRLVGNINSGVNICHIYYLNNYELFIMNIFRVAEYNLFLFFRVYNAHRDGYSDRVSFTMHTTIDVYDQQIKINDKGFIMVCLEQLHT